MMMYKLPRPYRMLAEYRREQQGGTSDVLHNDTSFAWDEAPEKGDFWQSVNNGDYPEIPAASIRELVDAGKLKASEVRAFVYDMFRSTPDIFSDDQVEKVIQLVECSQSGPQPPAPDPVNSPAHYTHGSVEVFDMMLAIWGAEKVRTYCEINAFKYRMRAGYKADAGEDIEKAKWYERKAKEI